jgi:hypothetical protein
VPKASDQADWLLGQRDIYVDKIVPSEDERQIIRKCARIRKAIAHFLVRLMPAAPVAAECFNGLLAYAFVDLDHSRRGFL